MTRNIIRFTFWTLFVLGAFIATDLLGNLLLEVLP